MVRNLSRIAFSEIVSLVSLPSFVIPSVLLSTTPQMLTLKLEMGQANEKIARVQDSYVAAASESWLESLERFLTQMKEYQVIRVTSWEIPKDRFVNSVIIGCS